jgi:DNA-binding GntR family transcriptional regulator
MSSSSCLWLGARHADQKPLAPPVSWFLYIVFCPGILSLPERAPGWESQRNQGAGAVTAIAADAPGSRDGDFALPTMIAAEIARVLTRQITFLKLQPDARITEEELCAQFGVSRSPVREAFRMLEADGLVVRTARRGVRVAPMNRTDLDEVYACRVALEGLAAAEAARAAKDHTVAQLGKHLDDMQAALDADDVERFFDRNAAMTRAIHAASGNATLLRIIAGIDQQALRYRYLAHLRTQEMLDLSLEGQREVVAAIVARKPLRARRRAESLIRRAHGVIARALAEAYPGSNTAE